MNTLHKGDDSGDNDNDDSNNAIDFLEC